MRISLIGKWCIAKRPAIALCVMGILGMVLAGWIPKDFEIIRSMGLAFGMFSSGMLASQHAAIWEPSEKSAKPPTG